MALSASRGLLVQGGGGRVVARMTVGWALRRRYGNSGDNGMKVVNFVKTLVLCAGLIAQPMVSAPVQAGVDAGVSTSRSVVSAGDGVDGMRRPVAASCCRVCRKGKACGNSCIARWKTCHQPPGCACDG